MNDYCKRLRSVYSLLLLLMFTVYSLPLPAYGHCLQLTDYCSCLQPNIMSNFKKKYKIINTSFQ